MPEVSLLSKGVGIDIGIGDVNQNGSSRPTPQTMLIIVQIKSNHTRREIMTKSNRQQLSGSLKMEWSFDKGNWIVSIV